MKPNMRDNYNQLRTFSENNIFWALKKKKATKLN